MEACLKNNLECGNDKYALWPVKVGYTAYSAISHFDGEG